MIEQKIHRLSHVARQLDTRIKVVVKYLNEIGINARSNPNTKLSNEVVSKLFKHFKSGIDDFIVLDPTIEILEWIKKDFNNLEKLNPEKFEDLVAYLLNKNGYKVEKCGKTNEKDGGIDIIAWRKDIVTFIIAVQVKFKYNINKKVTTGEVRDFVGALHICNYFNAGMLVTNSSFSIDSEWIEKLNHIHVELKDGTEIQNWLKGNYISNQTIDKSIQINRNKIIRITEFD